MKSRECRVLSALVALFFCSGLSGVGYQIIWSKAFGAGIGHEYPAVLAVVTAFMAGLALGGYLYEKLTRLSRLGPAAYGWLEIAIGLWGAASAFFFHPLSLSVIRLLGESPSTTRHWVTVFTAVTVALLPATAGMGATLAAIQQFVFALETRAVTGLLYGVNTAGAMLGALAAAFWLMPTFGLRNSILILAGLNLIGGAAALALANRARTFMSAIVDPSRKSTNRSGPECPRSTALHLFITGLLGIGFEALIVRALSHILESTVYTFALILAIYLLGSALGAAAFQRYPRLKIDFLFPALAFSCGLSAILLRWLPPAYFYLRLSFGDSLSAVAAAESIIAGCVFLLPAFFMGATFTGLAETSLRAHRSLGWSVALNSAGSAVAPILFGLVVLPAIGLKSSFCAIVLGYALLALRCRLSLACIVLLPFITTGRDLFIHRDQKIAFFHEGATASVAVLESTNGARVLKVNNRFQMGGTAARIAEERHADIPLLLHPAPKRALFIGLGTGITFATAARYPNLVADGVELLPGVVEALPLFQEKPGTFDNPSLRVHIADGRRFVLSTTNRYDVIIGDLFHPAQDGAAFLYTREHFTAIRDRLSPDGLFCQWLPLYQMDLSTIDLIAHTFSSTFPYAEMWMLRFNIDTPAIALIGWFGRPSIPTNIVEQKSAASELLREHLRTVALGDTLRLFGNRLGTLPQNGSNGSLALNTDENPIILFRAPYITFRQNDQPGTRLLDLINRYANAPLDPLLKSADPEFLKRLSAYVHARDVYLYGLMDEDKHDLTTAVNHYIESARLSPDFTSGYAQALGIATTLARQNPEAAQAILRQLIDAQPDRPVARQLLDRLTKQ